MSESKFSAKALMLCPICKNSYYSKLEVTVPDNYRDMKEINTAKDNNGDIVHLDICSSAAPIKKDNMNYKPKIMTITEFSRNLHDNLELKEVHVLMNGDIYEIKIKKFKEVKDETLKLAGVE